MALKCVRENKRPEDVVDNEKMAKETAKTIRHLKERLAKYNLLRYASPEEALGYVMANKDLTRAGLRRDVMGDGADEVAVAAATAMLKAEFKAYKL